MHTIRVAHAFDRQPSLIVGVERGLGPTRLRA
jgi:hypothetical protein